MTKLKWICISISLTLLLSLAVGGGALNIDQKWSFGGGNQFGYEGGFCFPGLCIGGSGGSRYNYGWDRFNGRFRETMYCKPLSCWGGSCDALHLHLDKGLYKSLISKNTAKRNPSSTVDHIPETFKYNVKKVKEVAMAPTVIYN